MGAFVGQPMYRPTGAKRGGRPIYKLAADFVYVIGRYEAIAQTGFSEHRIVVPAGFEFDLGSVPRPLWAIVAPTDWIRPYLLHDWLYTEGAYSRAVADALFRQALAEDGCGFVRRFRIWFWVRVCGGKAYGKTKGPEDKP